MAEEKKEKTEGGKKPKKVLHHIRTEIVRDHKGKVTGYVSHHAYKEHPTDHHSEPEKPMAVHDSAEEAGAHVAEQAGMEEGGGAGGQEPPAEAEQEAQGAPEGGPASAAGM